MVFKTLRSYLSFIVTVRCNSTTLILIDYNSLVVQVEKLKRRANNPA